MIAPNPMTLSDFVDQYSLEHDIAASTEKTYRYTVSHFERWHDGPISLTELDSNMVNEYLKCYAQDHAPMTVRSRKCDIMTLWHAAYNAELTEHPPLRVRKIRVPRNMPDAWTMDELNRVIKICRDLPGYFQTTGIKRSFFFTSFVMAMYDTALRLCDMLQIERAWINSEGVLSVTQLKTFHGLTTTLRPETIEAVDQSFPPVRTLCWPLWGRQEAFYVHFRKIVDAAGLTGGTKKIRKTSASYVEKFNPGGAQAHLGHMTPGLAYKHYVDPRISYSDRPVPPSLTTGLPDARKDPAEPVQKNAKPLPPPINWAIGCGLDDDDDETEGRAQ